MRPIRGVAAAAESCPDIASVDGSSASGQDGGHTDAADQMHPSELRVQCGSTSASRLIRIFEGNGRKKVNISNGSTLLF